MNLDYEKERFKKFLSIPSQHQLLYAILSLAAVCLIFGFIVGKVTTPDPEKIVKYDTVFVDKPVQLGGTLSPNTIVEVEDDEPVNIKPLPAITKYKVSNWVCAWGKWTGVVKRVYWSSNDPNVLVYEVQHYNEEDKEWYENPYYESELEPGKCN